MKKASVIPELQSVFVPVPSFLIRCVFRAIVATLCAGAAVCSAVAGPSGPARWEADIAAFEAQDRANPPGKGAVLFTGSSTIRLWKTLAEDLPSFKTLNRGFGGSQMSDLVFYFDRLVLPYEPTIVVVRSGGNDLHAGKSADQVLEDYKALADKLHTQLPKTQLVYVSLSPSVSRWDEAESTRKLNTMVGEYVKGSEWMKVIDAYDVPLGVDGRPRAELFNKDMLHFNAEGYKLFSARVRSFFEKSFR